MPAGQKAQRIRMKQTVQGTSCLFHCLVRALQTLLNYSKENITLLIFYVSYFSFVMHMWIFPPLSLLFNRTTAVMTAGRTRILVHECLRVDCGHILLALLTKHIPITFKSFKVVISTYSKKEVFFFSSRKWMQYLQLLANWPVDKAQKQISLYSIVADFTFYSKQKRSKADGNPALQSQATNPLLFFSPPHQQHQ